MTAGVGGPARFVGRERELEAVLDAAAAASAGRSGTVLLEAASGMGASRLIAETVALLAAGDGPSPGTTVLRAGGLPAWRGAPYAPFRAALDRHLAECEPGVAARLLGSGAELLLPLLPGVAARLPGAPAGPASRERLSERINEAVRGLLVRLAASGPVVLVVEDLHAIDPASRGLVSFLVQTLGERPVLVLGSFQPDALGRGHPLRAALAGFAAGPRPAVRIPLPPLDRAALRAFVASREGEAPSAPVVLLVAERSGGSPLVAEEVLDARRELSGASLTLPLDQLVVARAAGRSPECRRVLRMLSVAEGPLAPAELAAVAGGYDAAMGRPAPRSPRGRRPAGTGTDDDLELGIAEAVAHGFAEPARDDGLPMGAPTRLPGRAAGRVPRSFRIRHELVASALEADLLPSSRRRMHAAVAAMLTTRPAEAGRHWHQAHDAGRHLQAEIAAAAEAERFGAAQDALGHLEMAIELTGAPGLTGAPAGTDEVDLLGRAAEASSHAGDAGRAVAFLESALARMPDARDRAARARLTERLAAYQVAGGDREGALAACERALELLPAGPSVDRARVLATLATMRVFDGAYSEGGHLAEQAVATALAVGSAARPWLGQARCVQGVIDSWLGRPEAAVSRLEEALAIAVELHRLEDAFKARANLAAAFDLQGQHAAAVDVSLRGIEAAGAAGLEVAHGAILRGNAVDALISLGRWSEARAMAEQALDWAPSGVPFVIAGLGLATVLTETVAGDAAARLLGRLFLEIETVPYVELAVPVYQLAASLALWQGDLADATRAVDAGWTRVRRSEEWALAARLAVAALAVAAARADVAQERGDLAGLAAAREWGDGILRQAAAMVEASGVDRGTWLRRQVAADLATAACHAARARGRDDPAPWAAVADRWRELGRPYEVARALFGQARAALDEAARQGVARDVRDDARETARAPLLEAAAIGLQLEAMPFLRATADVAGRARIRLTGEVAAAIGAAGPLQPEPYPVAPPRPAGPPRSGSALRPGSASRADQRETAASFGLSPREQGVLAEIVSGRTNREIGERLFISEKTVGVHVGNILAKLGVGGRVEAATVALRLGLVDDLLASAKKPGHRGPGFERRRRGASR